MNKEIKSDCDHYMTLYNPDEELLELVRQCAGAEGLFVWGHRQAEL